MLIQDLKAILNNFPEIFKASSQQPAAAKAYFLLQTLWADPADFAILPFYEECNLIAACLEAVAETTATEENIFEKILSELEPNPLRLSVFKYLFQQKLFLVRWISPLMKHPNSQRLFEILNELDKAKLTLQANSFRSLLNSREFDVIDDIFKDLVNQRRLSNETFDNLFLHPALLKFEQIYTAKSFAEINRLYSSRNEKDKAVLFNTVLECLFRNKLREFVVPVLSHERPRAVAAGLVKLQKIGLNNQENYKILLVHPKPVGAADLLINIARNKRVIRISQLERDFVAQCTERPTTAHIDYDYLIKSNLDYETAMRFLLENQYVNRFSRLTICWHTLATHNLFNQENFEYTLRHYEKVSKMSSEDYLAFLRNKSLTRKNFNFFKPDLNFLSSDEFKTWFGQMIVKELEGYLINYFAKLDAGFSVNAILDFLKENPLPKLYEKIINYVKSNLHHYPKKLFNNLDDPLLIKVAESGRNMNIDYKGLGCHVAREVSRIKNQDHAFGNAITFLNKRKREDNSLHPDKKLCV